MTSIAVTLANFVGKIVNRLVFGVSVFHTYFCALGEVCLCFLAPEKNIYIFLGAYTSEAGLDLGVC
jgi:hypothetical protein